ncbi:hypothetical protein Tsubulata_016047 [Turnera subulata]|uniref:Receptor-like serine/threonine-protein kinase n=1 Tax=Turnera subulata TaxID=218843 RepID=A0A9Q0FKH2_9ROSI|nr:hypothetical protein Tsubulata_016047 [Turnera subulata]
MESFQIFTLFCSLLLSSVLEFSSAVDTITPNHPLIDGQTLSSSSNSFELGFFYPGSSNNRYLGIWHRKSPGAVLWVANRNNPLTDLSGVLEIGNKGDLVLLSKSKNIVWSSNASRPLTNPVAQLLDSGNLILKDSRAGFSDENHQWQSFDHPTDTVLPGMKIGWNLTSGEERYLASWKSVDDPSPGEFTYRLDNHGPAAQLIIFKGDVKKVRLGPWNGLFYGSIPVLKNPIFKSILVHSKDELYYTDQLLSSSAISRVTVNSSGSLQVSVMYEMGAEWTNLLSWPFDTCDNYGHCGANAICRTNKAPTCDCLKGFIPKSQGDVTLQNWFESRSCKRMTEYCQREEGFLRIAGVKVPDLLKFQLNESMDLKECETQCFWNCSCIAYGNSDMSRGGSGCLMWFGDLIDVREQPAVTSGQDLYVRVPASELTSVRDSNTKKRLKTIMAVTIPTLSAFLVLGLVFCTSCKKRKGTVSENDDIEVPTFDLDTISLATNYFSKANIIGEGGFGSVYKGRLLTGQEIAVKKLSRNSGQGIQEFRNEVVLIAKLQHKNLVGLVGSCIQGEDRMLVYEYMPNKSLDYFIFDGERSTLLGWQKRFNIVLGIAKGLLYLHQDSKLQIIHRDLKPSNILLDSKLNPKISDFGLARIFGEDGNEAKTKRVVGTYGYMSPEYAIDGTFSVKSDVFSLGVILLEIVTGKKNRRFFHPDHHHNLLGHAWLLWKQDKALELMDPSLAETCIKSQLVRCIHVGLLCVQKHPDDRPTMSSVVFMLGIEGVVLAQPKEPGYFFVERCSAMDAAVPGKETMYSINAVSTTSVLEGR